MKKALVVCHMGRHYSKFGHYDIKPLQELGYEVHFAANFSLDIDKVDDKSLILHQIDFQRFPFSLKNIKAYKQLKKIINNSNFDLIHCQSPVGGVLARLANKKLNHKCKIIYTAHGFHFYKGAPIMMWLLFYPIEKYFAKYTDTLITINKEDYELAKKRFNKRCNDIKYIPGIGIDLKKYDFNMNDKEKNYLRKSLELNKKDFVLIFPARLDKNKNQKFLIEVMELLVKKHSNIHLLLPGIDELNGYYQSIVKAKRLENNVHFLGYRADVHKLMRISDIAVSSSLREGLPVNILEAFASGLPVVALNCRGMKDLIENHINGFIANNICEFEDSVLYLYSNRKYLRLFKDNNKKIVKEFSNDIINEKYKRIVK